jgi:hypothetical protein
MEDLGEHVLTRVIGLRGRGLLRGRNRVADDDHEANDQEHPECPEPGQQLLPGHVAQQRGDRGLADRRTERCEHLDQAEHQPVLRRLEPLSADVAGADEAERRPDREDDLRQHEGAEAGGRGVQERAGSDQGDCDRHQRPSAVAVQQGAREELAQGERPRVDRRGQADLGQ